MSEPEETENTEVRDVVYVNAADLASFRAGRFSGFIAGKRTKHRTIALHELPAAPAEPGADDSLALATVIREMRQREAVGREKYGTDVDRKDLTSPQWRQHLAEELMDSLLYIKALARSESEPTNEKSVEHRGRGKNAPLPKEKKSRNKVVPNRS